MSRFIPLAIQALTTVMGAAAINKSIPIKTSEILSLKGKKIIAINPPVFDFAFMDLWSKPLGLLFLLQSLRADNCVSFIDCIAEGAVGEKTFGRAKILKEEIQKPEIYKNIPRRYNRFGISAGRLTERLKEIGAPDYVFITSTMTYWYLGVADTVKTIRQVFPDAAIILGGIYASLCFEHALTLGADYVVCDRTEPSALHPAFDLYRKPPYGVLMTSFGCPFSCRYCASNLLWQRYRRRNMSDVLADAFYQIDLGIHDIAFYDDALLLGKEEFFYPLISEISHKAPELRLHTPNGLHVRQIDERCAHTLFDGNFKTIRLSLESIDKKVAHDSSDKVARDEYASAVRNLHAAGYTDKDCETYILLGLPGQDIRSVRETISFARDCGGTPKLAEFSPIPGTLHFEEAVKKLPQLKTEPLLQNNSVYCSYFAKDILPETLQELKDIARTR